MARIMFLYTTLPDEAAASAMAEALVAEARATCVNSWSAGQSVYRWNGVVERAREWVLIAKTPAALCADTMRRIAELHPYDLPAIAALPVDDAASFPPYLAWIETLGET